MIGWASYTDENHTSIRFEIDGEITHVNARWLQVNLAAEPGSEPNNAPVLLELTDWVRAGNTITPYQP